MDILGRNILPSKLGDYGKKAIHGYMARQSLHPSIQSTIHDTADAYSFQSIR